jgi:hypothetical protein
MRAHKKHQDNRNGMQKYWCMNDNNKKRKTSQRELLATSQSHNNTCAANRKAENYLIGLQTEREERNTNRTPYTRPRNAPAFNQQNKVTADTLYKPNDELGPK